jgi:hypothetical protein
MVWDEAMACAPALRIQLSAASRGLARLPVFTGPTGNADEAAAIFLTEFVKDKGSLASFGPAASAPRRRGDRRRSAARGV